MKITWHPLARADLRELIESIAEDNPRAAYRVQAELKKQIGKLPKYPEMGRQGRVPGTRELVVAGLPYIAIYRVANDRVLILRLLHGARRWPTRL